MLTFCSTAPNMTGPSPVAANATKEKISIGVARDELSKRSANEPETSATPTEPEIPEINREIRIVSIFGANA